MNYVNRQDEYNKIYTPTGYMQEAGWYFITNQLCGSS